MGIPVGTVTLATDGIVSLVVEGKDKPIRIQYNGELYNFGTYQYQCYCITNKGKQSLRNDKVTKAKNLKDNAQAAYEELYGGEAKVEEEKPKKEVSDIGIMLEEKFKDALASAVVESIVAEAKPKIEKDLIETFGFKPIRHIIEVEENEYEIEGAVHEMFDTVLKFISRNLPVFLTGPAGSGKNHLVKQVCQAYYGTLDKFYSSNAVTNEYKITGFIDANGRYHETEFYKAFKYGGLFMLDEIDSSVPEVLVILNAAIANRYFEFPKGRIDAHPDFRVIAAGNTYGTGADLEYTGRFQLDAASLDRFALVPINYSHDIQLALSGGKPDIVEFLDDFRHGLKKAGMRFVISYRAVERMREMVDTIPDEDVVKYCVTKSLDHDDLVIITNEMQKKNNRYYKALERVA